MPRLPADTFPMSRSPIRISCNEGDCSIPHAYQISPRSGRLRTHPCLVACLAYLVTQSSGTSTWIRSPVSSFPTFPEFFQLHVDLRISSSLLFQGVSMESAIWNIFLTIPNLCEVDRSATVSIRIR